MADGSISISEVNPDIARATILRLLESNLPEAATRGRFEWLYLSNPHGAARVWLATNETGQAVGTSAAFPRKFKVAGDITYALVLSDFVVDAAYRSLGPAMALLRSTLAPVTEGSCDFALDHPSESMLAVYRRIGGTELGRQTRYVKLLKASGVLGRRWGTGVRTSVVGTVGDLGLRIGDRFRASSSGLTVGLHEGDFDDQFGQVGDEIERRRAVYGIRDPAYLNWRFRSGIRFAHSIVTVRDASRLMGYAVLQTSDDLSMTIVEFICPPEQRVEKALLNAVADHGRRCGAERVQASAVAGSAWYSILETHGFSAREQLPGPVVYASKGSQASKTLTDVTQWWITDGDRDG